MKRICTVIAGLLLITSSFAQGVEFSSSNLPIVIINTNGGEIVDDPKIVVDLAIIDKGNGERNSVTDPHNIYDGKAGIEIRGSSSQMFPKKQYGFELRKANGEDDQDVSLLGLPKEADWILFAPYNDKTLMRDVLAYQLGRSMGNYASRSRYCELVLNGEYMGVYVLLEKIKRGKNRVDIAKLEETEISGDDLTGGYILKIDKTTGGDEGGWYSSHPPLGRSGSQNTYFQYEYPKGSDIVSEQKAYIKNYVNQFENVLAGTNYKDPVEGWTKYADMNSFIDYFLMNELTKNADAYRLSTFMYKKKDSDGGKLFLGPIWDFNLGFGNVNYCTQGDPEGLVINFNSICGDDGWLVPFWWNKLWKDEAFRTAVTTRWNTLRENEFNEDTILGKVDSIAGLLDEAQQRNFTKWPVIGEYVWPNYAYDFDSYDEEVEWLQDWIEDRLDYLDGVFNAPITTGVDEKIVKNLDVTAYPNPFQEEVLFEYEIATAGVTRIEIFDATGRSLSAVTNTEYEAGKFSAKTTVNAPAGLYIYRVTHNSGDVVTGKVSKR